MTISKKIDWRVLVKNIRSIAKFSRYYLVDTGWINSAAKMESVDADGRAIPWLTYPAIDFLSEKNFAECDVLEFGSGNSTIWWSQRAKSIVSLEHDVEHYRKICKIRPQNVQLLLRAEKKGIYAQAPLGLKKLFDLIVIDGVNRMQCLSTSLRVVKTSGVIIFDNSTRLEYASLRALCKTYGFKNLDFFGPTPISPYKSCTSIFYRKDNVLGI